MNKICRHRLIFHVFDGQTHTHTVYVHGRSIILIKLQLLHDLQARKAMKTAEKRQQRRRCCANGVIIKRKEKK